MDNIEFMEAHPPLSIDPQILAPLKDAQKQYRRMRVYGAVASGLVYLVSFVGYYAFATSSSWEDGTIIIPLLVGLGLVLCLGVSSELWMNLFTKRVTFPPLVLFPIDELHGQVFHGDDPDSPVTHLGLQMLSPKVLRISAHTDMESYPYRCMDLQLAGGYEINDTDTGWVVDFRNGQYLSVPSSDVALRLSNTFMDLRLRWYDAVLEITDEKQ